MTRRGRLQPFLLALLLLWGVVLPAQDSTVVVIRHAERRSLLDGDSPLAEAGLRRAQALVPQLEAFQPAVLFTSELQRTQQTLAPTARKLGLKPLIRSKDDSESLAAEILRNHRGQTVLVCWHHDRMKKLLRGLGVKTPIPYWPLSTYDWLWIVRVPATGEAMLEQRHQSAPAATAVSQGG